LIALKNSSGIYINEVTRSNSNWEAPKVDKLINGVVLEACSAKLRR